MVTIIFLQAIDGEESFFSNVQVVDIIQMVSTIIIALMTTWLSYQQLKIKGQVTDVKGQVTNVHNEINSKMQKALDAQYDLGKADEKAAQVANKESKPNKSDK